MEVLAQGKHNMAIPEVAREALSPAWQVVQQQRSGRAGTVLGGSQASRGKAAEEKVRFFLTKEALFCGSSGIASV